MVADPAQLEKLLREGKNKMPAVGATWSPQELQAAATYLKERFGGS